jgi:ribosomal protein L15
MNIEQSLEKWLGKKLISKDGEFYDIDLGKIGYQKVLSRGKVNTKLKIKTLYASKSAIDKVKKAGGEVNTLGNVKEEISKDE